MAITPRSVDDILESLRQTRQQVDPIADSNKGPMSVILYCYANELARVEQHASYLSSIYQLELADELPREDLENLGRNYGKDPNVGQPATVTVTVYMYSRPAADATYTLAEGTLVSTVDGRYIFATVRPVTMNGASADLYYNADTQRYEVSVLAEATAVGDDYNLPEGTLTAFIGNVPDFDGVTNNKPASNGSDPLSPIQFRNVIWDSMQGLNEDIGGNIIATIYEVNPAAFDSISFVPSFDYKNFKRLKYMNGKLGYDVYLISDLFLDDIITGSAIGGETDIVLQKKPVLGVEYVTVDGQPVPFAFVQDRTSPYSGSPLGFDKVTLSTALLPAQSYEIRYYYYSLVYDAWEALRWKYFPFQTDVLCRRANAIPVFVRARMTTTSLVDRDTVVNDIRLFTESYFRDPSTVSSAQRTFVQALDPYDYQESVVRAVNGIATFALTDFVRIDKALMDIETITFDGMTEYPLLSPLFEIV